MRVAVAQFTSSVDLAANRERALCLVRSAADGGAELVVLPEAAMYPFDRPLDELERVCLDAGRDGDTDGRGDHASLRSAGISLAL